MWPSPGVLQQLPSTKPQWLQPGGLSNLLLSWGGGPSETSNPQQPVLTKVQPHPPQCKGWTLLLSNSGRRQGNQQPPSRGGGTPSPARPSCICHGGRGMCVGGGSASLHSMAGVTHRRGCCCPQVCGGLQPRSRGSSLRLGKGRDGSQAAGKGGGVSGSSLRPPQPPSFPRPPPARTKQRLHPLGSSDGRSQLPFAPRGTAPSRKCGAKEAL